MARSLLASTSALLLIGSLGIGEAFAFGVPKMPGGGKLPGLGGGGGGTMPLQIKQKQSC